MKLVSKILSKAFVYKWYILSVLVFALGTYGAIAYKNNAAADESESLYVISRVARGAVSSGIEATGEIVAAQKLDLDVYKQLSRIDVVNVANGSHVEPDEILIGFDKSDASVETEASRVAALDAELALQTQRANATDPNTKARTLQTQIEGYSASLVSLKQDLTDAHRDFLNANLSVEPHPTQAYELADEIAPTVSGRYVSDVPGEYVVEIYRSGASSGFSFRLSGLESGSFSIYSDTAVDLGTRGLKLTFPESMSSGDKWVITIPNTHVATYEESKRTYEEKVIEINADIDEAKVNLANAKQDLADLLQTDSSAYRDLNVEKAELEYQKAQQQLKEKYDVLRERNIVAPFAGTVQDMENVVAGATPTGGTNDPINLGTLVSDKFLVTFTLSAADVAKIALDQKVKVTVSSLSNTPSFEATITEISSLPEDEGVAQYKVQAELAYDRPTAEVVLREGLLADIEVVQEENADALRIPRSAVSYQSGSPTVTVVDSLSEEQQTQMDTIGIVRTNAAPLATYPKEVKLGIQGSYYVEVLDGLTEGNLIQTTASAPSAETVVSETRFGPPGGGARQTSGNAVRFQNRTGGTSQTQ